jgi:hypothetical protein
MLFDQYDKLMQSMKEQKELEKCSFYPEINTLNRDILYGERSPVKGYEENVYRMKKADFDRKLNNLIKENMGRSSDEVMRSLNRYEGFGKMLGLDEKDVNNSEKNVKSPNKIVPSTPKTLDIDNQYLPNSEASELDVSASQNSSFYQNSVSGRPPSKKDTLKHINDKFSRFQKQFEPEAENDPRISDQHKGKNHQNQFSKKNDAINDYITQDIKEFGQPKIFINPIENYSSTKFDEKNFLLSNNQNFSESDAYTKNAVSINYSNVNNPVENQGTFNSSPRFIVTESAFTNSEAIPRKLENCNHIFVMEDDGREKSHSDRNSDFEYEHSIWQSNNIPSKTSAPDAHMTGFDTFKSEYVSAPHNFTLGNSKLPLLSNINEKSNSNQKLSKENCFEKEIEIDEVDESEVNSPEEKIENDTSITHYNRGTDIVKEMLAEENSEESSSNSQIRYEKPKTGHFPTENEISEQNYLNTFGNDIVPEEESGYLINLDIELPTGKHEQLHIKSFKEINKAIDQFVEQHNLIEEAKTYLKQLISDQLENLGFGELSRDFIH